MVEGLHRATTAVAPLRGLVLAGGRSERMGRDKAAIELAARSLLDRAVTNLRNVVPDVRVAVRPAQAGDPLRAAYPLVLDEFNGMGPAAGLLAAHAQFPDSAWLVIACDMPLISAALLAQLLAVRDPSLAATAWLSATDGRPEPLCAIYEPATLASFRQHVQAGGSPGLRAWLQTHSARLLRAPSTDILMSANTPAELARIAALAAAPNTQEPI